MVSSNHSSLMPVQHAARLLGVDGSTLRRWLHAAGLSSRAGAIDRRERLVSRAEVLALARLHHRVVVWPGGSTDLVDRVVALEVQVAELAALVEDLRKRG